MSDTGNFARASLNLTEHLLRKSRRKVLETLEKRMRLQVAAYLSGEPWPRSTVARLLDEAYYEGARFAVPMLPAGVKEADQDSIDAAFIASLPGVDRTEGDILHDLNTSASTADVESRAEATAKNEISIAYHNGMGDVAADASDKGIEVQKQWLNDPGACPICEDNAAEGWIAEDINFSSGDDFPPAHPNCRCSVEFRES